MKKETIKNIFDFLQEKGEHRTPFLWKWKNNIPLTKEELIVKGDLNLEDSEITSLPKGLEVLGWLFITDTGLGIYSDEELREMIKPGFIKGKIDRE